MAINLDEFADAWGMTQAAAPQPAPPPVQQQVVPAAPQAQQTNAQAAQAQWRKCPDGSLISSEYALDWGGEIGDPYSRVQLRHGSGEVVFDGAYAELLAQQIQGVWIPGARVVDDENPDAPVAATAVGDGFTGMPAKSSTAKKVVGGILVAGGVGALLWSGYKLFSGMSGDSPPPDEE